VNAGIGNAKELEIDLTFPDNVFVAETRKLPEVQKRPTPPEPEDVDSLLTLAKLATTPPSAERQLHLPIVLPREAMLPGDVI
jgi:hypothetical protein